MDKQAYQAGKAAYQSGDFNGAIEQLVNAVDGAGGNGAAEHMLGNAYMRLGRYGDAIGAYTKALSDTSYGRVGPLNSNRGRAYLAKNDPDSAIDSLQAAVADDNYHKKYKAYLALGQAYELKDDPKNAGIAYRSAAIDENNPDPALALRRLGRSFIELHRPVDAVEAYRTAIDFATPMENQNTIYAELGMAYVAANRMSEAVDAFAHATSDGTYRLSTDMQIAYDAAKRSVAANSASSPSDTDALLQRAGYGKNADNTYDPLDPLGKSGQMMPSPDESGFFSVSEEDLVKADKKKRKEQRKEKHTGRKVAITIVIILAIVLGVGGYAYYRGYGYPSQSDVIASLFSAKTSGRDEDAYLSGSLSDAQRTQIEAIIPSGASVTVEGLDQSAQDSTARINAHLSSGEDQKYTVSLVRDGLSWKVSDIQLSYDSNINS